MWRKSTTSKPSTDNDRVSGGDPAAATATASARVTGTTRKWPLRSLFPSASQPSQTTLSRQYQLHKKMDTVECDDDDDEDWDAVEPTRAAAVKNPSSTGGATAVAVIQPSTLHTSGGDDPSDDLSASVSFAAAQVVAQLPGMNHVRQRHGGPAPVGLRGSFNGLSAPVVTADANDAEEEDWGAPVKPTTSALPAAPVAAAPIAAVTSEAADALLIPPRSTTTTTRTEEEDDSIFVSDDAAVVHHRRFPAPAHTSLFDMAVLPSPATSSPLLPLNIAKPHEGVAPASPPAPSSTAAASVASYAPAPAAFHSGIRGLRTSRDGGGGGAVGEAATLDRGKKKKKGLRAVAILPFSSPNTPAATPAVVVSGSSRAEKTNEQQPQEHSGGADLLSQRRTQEAERQRLVAEEAERKRLVAEETERQRLVAEEAERAQVRSDGVEAARIVLEALYDPSCEHEVRYARLIPLTQKLSNAEQLLFGGDAVAVDGDANPFTCYRELLRCLLDSATLSTTGSTDSTVIEPLRLERAVGSTCETWSSVSAGLPSAWKCAWGSAVQQLTSLAAPKEEAGDRGPEENPSWIPAQRIAAALTAHLTRCSRQVAVQGSCSFSLVDVHACVMVALREALSLRRACSPVQLVGAAGEPASWVQPLLGCVAQAALLSDGKIKSRAIVPTSPCRSGQDGERAGDAVRRVQRQLREGSWVLWYLLRVVGLMSWWDAVESTLAQNGKASSDGLRV
ncbi:hypothetical protein ABB37_08842 [Leptomonas pyrrhocoris]|uniref:Uncharacterized protein n=1 Tax=Leptomonas pyrrhocoris TaxID=157538 RepID=A0A0N0VDC0_LEPPY|nr:hypothetical protein ABB37_08842 [Leptomonas pyrrhocoris]KPA75182.1 hypothetical protein ABB37_08842 [Leptomonas pyrrhocoris]|eukprot:XP_015653621.1 hypothetical protein ABB37_08842 [Leptomonas pyrrhocoris]